MAWTGGKFGDGATTGTTRASLATVTGYTKTLFKHAVLRAGAGNAGTIYFGTVAVSTAGANAWGFLGAGEAVTFGPEAVEFDMNNVYLIGSNAADVAYFTLATGPGQ